MRVGTKIQWSVSETCGKDKNLNRMTAKDVQCVGQGDGVTENKTRAAVTRDNMVRKGR
jgi:hypothetical protein